MADPETTTSSAIKATMNSLVKAAMTCSSREWTSRSTTSTAATEGVATTESIFLPTCEDYHSVEEPLA